MESCPRTELVSKLKKVADTLGNRRRIPSRRQETIKETKNEKYVSKWVPDYTHFKPCQHPLYPFPRPPNDVQLLASDIIGMCLCLKRNGLQDDCPKLGCRGVETRRCVTRPIPTCVPSGLGRLPPQPIRISRPKVLPHPEVVRSNRMKRANEKKQRILRYINMGSKNYTNEYCRDVFFKPCYRHDGTYVRKNLQRDRHTQIRREEYCSCKQATICDCKGTPSEMCDEDDSYVENESKTENANTECNSEDDLRNESKSEEPNASLVENVFREKIEECKENMINTKSPPKENDVISNPSKEQTNLSTRSFEKTINKNIPDFCTDKDIKQTIKVLKL